MAKKGKKRNFILHFILFFSSHVIEEGRELEKERREGRKKRKRGKKERVQNINGSWQLCKTTCWLQLAVNHCGLFPLLPPFYVEFVYNLPKWFSATFYSRTKENKPNLIFGWLTPLGLGFLGLVKFRTWLFFWRWFAWGKSLGSNQWHTIRPQWVHYANELIGNDGLLFCALDSVKGALDSELMTKRREATTLRVWPINTRRQVSASTTETFLFSIVNQRRPPTV